MEDKDKLTKRLGGSFHYIMETRPNPFSRIELKNFRIDSSSETSDTNNTYTLNSYEFDLITEQYAFNTVEEITQRLKEADDFLFDFFSRYYVGQDLRIKGDGTMDNFNHLGILVEKFEVISMEESIRVTWYITIEL
jgi:hypothetical protein